MPEKFGEQPEEEPEREGRFCERLKNLAPAFIEIRERMGIGESVGFGYLPEVHSEGQSLGALPEIKRMKSGDIEYSVTGRLQQTYWEKLPKEKEINIIVPPKYLGRRSKIVSVCDPYAKWDTSGEFSSLIDASDDVYIGIIAHELAHTYTSKSKFSPEVRKVLSDRCKKEFPDTAEKWKWQYDVNDEQEVDIIASLFGYKDQIIAKIDFMLDRFNKLGPYAKGRDYAIKSLENRKKQVLEYCA